MRAENERIRAEGDQKDAKLKEILAEYQTIVRIGVANLPSLSSVEKKTAMACRQHPAWTFTDTADTNETRRRNNVASRFLCLVRKN